MHIVSKFGEFADGWGHSTDHICNAACMVSPALMRFRIARTYD